MMEIAIAVFIGLWLTVASVMSYAWLKKELGGEQEDKKK